MAVLNGYDPSPNARQAIVLPLHHRTIKTDVIFRYAGKAPKPEMAPAKGIDPLFLAPQTSVLPLNYTGINLVVVVRFELTLDGF